MVLVCEIIYVMVYVCNRYAHIGLRVMLLPGGVMLHRLTQSALGADIAAKEFGEATPYS